MFAEIQKIGVEVGTQGAKLDQVVEQVGTLNKEMFHGSSNQPSIKSQLLVMDRSLRDHESDIRGLKKSQDENRQSVVDLEKETTVFVAETKAKNEFLSTKMTNRTKVLLAILGLVGTITATVFGYWASTGEKDPPPKTEKASQK